MKEELITKELLKQWEACSDCYELYCKLFPNGTGLETAMQALIDHGEERLAFWLFRKCDHNDLFKEITCHGFRNKGHHNTGHWNVGNHNSGNYNRGDRNTGTGNEGFGNTGMDNIGTFNAGTGNRGEWNTGSDNHGRRNAGNGNRCAYNTGSNNNGYLNSGRANNGDRNTGSWNACNYSTGFFNTKTPDEILVFNKPCSRKKAWEEARPEDRIKVKELPNFDADVFFEITGIDLRNNAD